MTDKLYRIETTGIIEDPKMSGDAILYCDGGMAFVKLHPVRINAKPKTDGDKVPNNRWTWKYLHDDDYQTLVCSNCLSAEGAGLFYNYCPCCGVKMSNGVW